MNSDHAETKKLADKVMKTSAVVLQLDGGASEYGFQTKARTVAISSLK